MVSLFDVFSEQLSELTPIRVGDTLYRFNYKFEGRKDELEYREYYIEKCEVLSLGFDMSSNQIQVNLMIDKGFNVDYNFKVNHNTSTDGNVSTSKEIIQEKITKEINKKVNELKQLTKIYLEQL